jgi:hypothetical protein
MCKPVARSTASRTARLKLMTGVPILCRVRGRLSTLAEQKRSSSADDPPSNLLAFPLIADRGDRHYRVDEDFLRCATLVALCVLAYVPVPAQDSWRPPSLPDGRAVTTDRSPEFLKPTVPLAPGVSIAATPPSIEFLYYPEQTYPGHPWSVWADGVATAGKYYSGIGDHGAPAGNAFVYEYVAATHAFRTLVDVKKFLNMPGGHYSPGKIHSRIDMGSDGWLYYATHRGSTRVTTDLYHFTGDWLLRTNPVTARTEVVARGPVPRHSIPTGLLDPDRLIFYGGTVAGDPKDDTIMFFAYDTRARKVLHTVPGGPSRYLIFAHSTGRVYYVHEDGGPLMRYDPASGMPPMEIPGKIGIRAATRETSRGDVFTVSGSGDATLWRFNTRSEQVEALGKAPVASQDYVTSLDVDPTGRYLYYIPGAHGSSERDGSPIVQFDVKTRTKKVIAFLHPFYRDAYGYTPLGTYSSALSPEGDKLYVTWNGNRSGSVRGRTPWDTVALTVVHIPESERRP